MACLDLRAPRVNLVRRVKLERWVLRDLLDPKVQMEKRVARDQEEKRVCQESSG